MEPFGSQFTCEKALLPVVILGVHGKFLEAAKLIGIVCIFRHLQKIKLSVSVIPK